jgi:putative ABC transport system substrate-binding protein
MRRREFLALMGGAAAIGLPLAAQAQPRMPRVGILLAGGPETMGPLQKELRNLGYIEGQNIQFEVRSAEGQISRLPELAAELVRGKVDIIIASITPAVTAARDATRDIPIIMAPGNDPVALGLIASFARPGGNITGVTGSSSELWAKNLEFIREALPAARLVGVPGNANDPFTKPFLEQIQQGARTIGLEIYSTMVRGGDELQDAFAELGRQRADAVIIQGSLPVKATVDLALKYRLPAFTSQRAMAHAGHLVSYSANDAERGLLLAGYVDKLLKGAKPADLPVQQPTRFQLVINLKTAKLLGLTVPPTLLARADEVIE